MSRFRHLQRCCALLLLAQGAPVLAAPAPFFPAALIFADAAPPVQADGGPVQASALLLGAWRGGRWLPPTAAARHLPGRRNWQVQALGVPGDAASGAPHLRTGGPLQPGDEPCAQTVVFGVDLPAPPHSAPLRAAPSPLAQPLLLTAPGLNVRPRPVTLLPTVNSLYRTAVQAELVRRGLNAPKVVVTSVTRADLDGDGVAEVIIGASYFQEQEADTFAPPPDAVAGDYSLLLLRWVRNGQVQTTLLGGGVYTAQAVAAGRGQAPNRYGLAGVADLNGDGRMELIVTAHYYEGEAAAVLEWTPAGGVRERLNEGCGV